jgi:dienelactone hydrolase
VRRILLRCRWQIIGLISCAIFAPVSLTAQENRFADRKTAMTVFADLLRIPSSSPGVSVTVSSTKEEEGLITEDVSWDSLDNERPTAFVIRPVDAGKRLPAVVCLHGTGGSRESMCTQKFGIGEWTRPGDKTSHTRLLGWARELSRRGYLILALTQRGLDRRTPDTDDQAKDLLVRGRTIMGAIVYEIRQAVTYLQSRPDVNPNKIGMTGLSFGGITTFYAWLVDDRVAAAAPICGGVGSVDVFLRLGRRGYHGYYWWIPDMLTKGDQGDFAAAMAPRPFMLWAPLNDIGMPNEGVDRFLEVVRPAYARSRAQDALLVHRPPGEHAFTLEAFEAMVAFFDQQLKLE